MKPFIPEPTYQQCIEFKTFYNIFIIVSRIKVDKLPKLAYYLRVMGVTKNLIRESV